MADHMRDGTTARQGRVSSKNQVTLPVALMRSARIKAGAQVQFSMGAQGRITVAPVRRVPALEPFIGIWRDQVPYRTGDALVEDLRGPADL